MFNKPINRWWTVLAGGLGCAAGTGVISSYAFGVFIKAIAAEYHWGRSLTTASISSFYICSAAGFVVLGHLISKSSVRAVSMVFVAAFAASIAAIGLLPGSPILFCLMFGAAGFFGAAATAMPYSIAISGWFDRNRGLALALAVGGTGIGGIFMSRYAAWLLQHYGWRGGYVGIGLTVGLISLAGLLFFFRMPEREFAASERVMPYGDILKDRNFWLIFLPVLLTSTALLGTITNLAPLLSDRGMPIHHAAEFLGLVGAASWFTRVGLGVALDRVHVRYVASPIFLVVAAGALVLLKAGVGPLVPVGVVLIGLGMGSEADLVSYMSSRYFGPRSLSRANGVVWVGFAAGSGIGVFIGSLSFDLTGSYQAALVGFALFAIAAAAIVLLLPAYSFGGAEHDAEAKVGAIAPLEAKPHIA